MPATGVEEPCLVSVKVLPVTVLGSMSSENVASMLAVGATPVAAFAGETLATVGALLSILTVKVFAGDSRLPAVSVAK